MSNYPDGLGASDYCFMEGCEYPDPNGSYAQRKAFAHGRPQSTCISCGRVNYGYRSFLGWERRRQITAPKAKEGEKEEEGEVNE